MTSDDQLIDLRHYLVEERLKDGTQVTLRAVRPDDGSKIRRAFEGLGRETIYTRFFGYKSDVSDAELNRITGVDFKREFALLATVGSGNEEVVIGGVSCFVIDAGSRLVVVNSRSLLKRTIKASGAPVISCATWSGLSARRVCPAWRPMRSHVTSQCWQYSGTVACR